MFVYFMSDVPHLMKTTRNCWLCSQFGGTCCLWIIIYITTNHIITHMVTHTDTHLHTLTESLCKVCIFKQINGEHILWAHLHQLCDKCQAKCGLYIGNKLRHEHLYLTSYSKMNVRLATQVFLSLSLSLSLINDSCVHFLFM